MTTTKEWYNLHSRSSVGKLIKYQLEGRQEPTYGQVMECATTKGCKGTTTFTVETKEGKVETVAWNDPRLKTIDVLSLKDLTFQDKIGCYGK